MTGSRPQAHDHAGGLSTIYPQQIMFELIGGGVAERYPELHFA